MSARHRARPSRRRRGGVVIALILAACSLLVPGAYGGFVARVGNDTNTAATSPYFTCAAAQGGTTPNAYFTYPFGESGGLTAADVSGNNRAGAYSSLLNTGITPVGVTYGVANSGTDAVCPRDKRTVITLNGLTGFVSGPNAVVTGPNTFSVEIWFKTSAAQGKLIGFGNNRNTLSGSYDRHLYIDSTGRLVFGVFPNAYRTVDSPNPVNDGKWHHAVGTLSSAGMVLYLDGKPVDNDKDTTTAQSFSGYWRIGWDNLATWPNAPASNYFSGSLAFASVYTGTALTAAQVAQHYAAGR